VPDPLGRVLVIDDDPTLREVVSDYLRRAGLDVAEASDGLAALALAEAAAPDLVVLDLMLPGIDGLEVCRRLRAAHPGVAVVMLTARGEEEDRIAGFEVGADDYVVKPFSPRELTLRVQSVLRRASAQPAAIVDVAGEMLVDDDLVVNVSARTATLADAALPLTNREFDLLAFLMRHPERAFTRELLLRGVWGWDFGDQTTVTVHARRLREKVEQNPAEPTRLVTVRGVGYRWDPRAGSTLDQVAAYRASPP
jgi:two-component system, OmpR family, response regulator ResD